MRNVGIQKIEIENANRAHEPIRNNYLSLSTKSILLIFELSNGSWVPYAK